MKNNNQAKRVRILAFKQVSADCSAGVVNRKYIVYHHFARDELNERKCRTRVHGVRVALAWSIFRSRTTKSTVM